MASKALPAGKIALGATRTAAALNESAVGLGKVGSGADLLTGAEIGTRAGFLKVLSKHKVSPALQELLEGIGQAAVKLKTPLGVGGTQRAVDSYRNKLT